MALFGHNSKTPLGIYIHVPFCRSKCVYCDFYSLTDKSDQLMDAYLAAICRHIKESGDLAPDHRVDTIYFGGGTPSFFGADGMATILSTIRRAFDVDSHAEITFEANPDSVSPRLLRRLRSEGFNRVSLGIQCDDDEILEKIGLQAEECLMVGNDVTEDMVASKLGMRVFLLTDNIINKNGEDITVYPRGSFDELVEYIKTQLS